MYQFAHNFRQVYPILNDPKKHGNQTDGPGTLYRSSRPDFMTESEVDKMKEMGIQSIVDLRSRSEYLKATGDKHLDRIYKPLKVLLPGFLGNKPSDAVKVKAFKTTACSSNANTSTEQSRKHYFINFYNWNYIWTIFNRATWYIKLYGILLLVIDVIFHTNYKHFIRLFARNVLNVGGLLEQYIDMIEMSQPSICAALKLLATEGNLPAVINCAHGKDRTGILTALVLSCVGASREHIARDYALSEAELRPVHSRCHDEVVKKFHMSEQFLKSDVETMEGLLDYIDRENRPF
ncbi:uncharacterized protein LOC106155892 isoform X2 [Lingula anatina]|uniref:Uncharacterized protein LOC106155892 isoform X2 n=1 Tax=Lingula anatina TaxID=7574 RepID=A0A1S3HJS4_LINAN|nr:uncharacterized protein LOC106155892 isoform X2 [Lingula anatina]|eukprot:XP_013386375.1 uncharacterized protein LOC106155892 isoform X2 [Lingula anatina]